MIEDRHEEVLRILNRYHKTQSQNSNAGSPSGSLLSDEKVLELLRTAKNKDKFERLYDRGDITEYGGDKSAADQALVNLIYFFTQDGDQIDRIFQDSTLCRPKWTDRPDYRERTINTARESITETYQPDDGARLIVGGGGSNRHKGVSLSPSLNTGDTKDTFRVTQFCDEPEPEGERPFLIEGVMPERFPMALYGDGGRQRRCSRTI
jgi:primase-polymerase (primpol)-like protein